MTIVSICFPNTSENQKIARQIRKFHKEVQQPLTVSFTEDAAQLVLEAPCLYIPDKRMLSPDAVISGLVSKTDTHFEIHPRTRGKTINLHLDSELVAELEQIRKHVQSKTQHDVILEMFVRGIRAYREERGED